MLKSFEEQASSTPAIEDSDSRHWVMTSSGGAITLDKEIRELSMVPGLSRRECYRAWRLNPHARGILRTFQKFIIGRGFRIDSEDKQRGIWDDAKTRIIPSDNEDDKLAVMLVWEDFVKRNKFNLRDKEIVLRTLRDGDCFIRRFKLPDGRTTIRFIEPGHVQSDGKNEGTGVNSGGKTVKTIIREGIESSAEDVEDVIAYWIKVANEPAERIEEKDIIHLKCLADSNDARGIPLLEANLKMLGAYQQWIHYRLVLNQARAAVALVRNIKGSASQASTLLANRGSGRAQPEGREPQTGSGRRESMFRSGSILTASEGVSYEFLSPKLEARDAGEDGRRIMLAVAAGLGLPEMLVTSDWSNSNFASAVEGRSPATREWEDWQDFFEFPFSLIWFWVMNAAVEENMLPKTTKMNVTFAWPSIIQKDAPKETDRNAVLFLNGIISEQTWSAREDLDWETETRLIHDEAESAALDPLAQITSSLPAPTPPGVLDNVPPSPNTPGLLNKSRLRPGPPRHAARGPEQPRIATEQAQRAQVALMSLADLRDKIEQLPKELRESYGSYLDAASALLLVEEIESTTEGYIVWSQGRSKRLGGPYKTRAEAEKRLKQVEMFKHMKEDTSTQESIAVIRVSLDRMEQFVKGLVPGRDGKAEREWLENQLVSLRESVDVVTQSGAKESEDLGRRFNAVEAALKKPRRKSIKINRNALTGEASLDVEEAP